MKTQIQTKSILVTGGAGFIGTHLCKRLTEQGHSVTVLDLRAPETVVKGVSYHQGDVRNAALLEKLAIEVDAIYHLAATVSVPVCQKDPVESYSNNFFATLMVLETIRKIKETKGKTIAIAFASTAALYGNNGDKMIALEEHMVSEDFSSFYAAQKYNSENAIGLFHRNYGIPAVIFRFFNVFGPGQDPTSPYSGVITVFATLAKQGKVLGLNGGGTQTRDFVSVTDIARACASALELPFERWTAKPMNLGTNKRITIKELADAINSITQNRAGTTVAPARDGDVQHSLASIKRAQETLGYQPTVSLEKGLSELLLS